jgi:integral membrane protein
MAHGVAFLAYIAMMVVALPGNSFGIFGWLRTFLASFVPFGTFINDPFIKRMEAKNAASEV